MDKNLLIDCFVWIQVKINNNNNRFWNRIMKLQKILIKPNFNDSIVGNMFNCFLDKWHFCLYSKYALLILA